jgi:hypothetical protein
VSENGTVLSNSTYPDTQTADWMHLNGKSSHYGCGFSAGIIIAKGTIAVLHFHAALVVGHMVVVCFPRKVGVVMVEG